MAEQVAILCFCRLRSVAHIKQRRRNPRNMEGSYGQAMGMRQGQGQGMQGGMGQGMGQGMQQVKLFFFEPSTLLRDVYPMI